MSKLGRTLVIGGLLFASLLQVPPSFAVNYTVTYNANAGYVGALSNSTNGVAQAGATTGSVPTSQSVAAGTSVALQAQGDLARQGFTFAGWSTAQNGNGTLYAPGTQYTVNADITLYAKWTVPLAARLIGNGGSMISVSNPNAITNGSYCLGTGVRGITSDGTSIYFRPAAQTGYICKTTPAGVVESVNRVVGLENVPVAGNADSIAIVYGNGCLFLRKDTGSTLGSIYCIALSNWSLNSVTLSVNMPAGTTWLYGNFIQFPDGRIGSVGAGLAAATFQSTYPTLGTCPTAYCKVLRIYTVSGTGTGVLNATFSKDFVLADFESWPGDDHGIATDGTYLYQIYHARGYKVWALQNTGPSYLVFNGDGDNAGVNTGHIAGAGTCQASTGVSGSYCQITYPIDGYTTNLATKFTNGTYLGRAHGLNRYLIGDYEPTTISTVVYTRFWLSDSVAPPPGPGNPDIVAPSFTSSDTFTVTENISPSFTAATIVVNESATITIASGLDGSQFNIVYSDTAVAIIQFKVSPDYEGPTDAGGNNQYDITLNATDSAGNTGVRQINIRVTNLNESASIATPTVSGSVYKGVQIAITATVNAPGKVRFFMDGKRIANCLSVSTTGSYPNYTASCNWKPTSMASHKVTAYLTPSDVTFTGGSSPVLTVWVLKRTTSR